jgi:hypothetical protein
MTEFRIPNTNSAVEIRQAFQQVKMIDETVSQLSDSAYCQWIFRLHNTSSTSCNISFTKTGKVLFRYDISSTYALYSNELVETLVAGNWTIIFCSNDGPLGITEINASYSRIVGSVPDISNCTQLISINLSHNDIDSYQSGTLITQKYLTNIELQNNLFSESAINSILADLFVNKTSRGLLPCTVDLSGSTNASPTGDGLAAKNALIAAGWTVTTN